MARAQVLGFQGPRLGTPGRVIAKPKYFAGYGASLGGCDWDEVDVSEGQLPRTGESRRSFMHREWPDEPRAEMPAVFPIRPAE